MPITDLTGYTWVGNGYSSIESSGATTLGEWAINFVSNGNNYTEFSYDGTAYPEDPVDLWFNNTLVCTDTGWVNEAYKTIVITGGDDVTNEDLISWLENTGTLTAPAPSISDLTGTKWLINLTPVLSPLANNESDPDFGEWASYIFDITGTSYEDYEINSIELTADDVYGFAFGLSGMNVYEGDLGGWTYGEGFRTIEITGGTDVTNADLIAWLEANATQVVSATPSLNFGGSDVTLFLGSSYVSKVYLGSTLLYEGEAPSVTLISFEVGNTTYQAEQGMTWAQWLASNYNINGFYSQYGYIQYSANDYVVIADGSNTAVQPTDTIIDNGEYVYYIAGGGND